jgi:hypothetical protein
MLQSHAVAEALPADTVILIDVGDAARRHDTRQLSERASGVVRVR